MSAEDLEKYETEMELQLYREYRDIVRLFAYVVETERRFYLANAVDLQVRNADGEVFFELTHAGRLGLGHVPAGPLRQERPGRDVQGRQRRGAGQGRALGQARPIAGFSPGGPFRRPPGVPSMVAGTSPDMADKSGAAYPGPESGRDSSYDSPNQAGTQPMPTHDHEAAPSSGSVGRGDPQHPSLAGAAGGVRPEVSPPVGDERPPGALPVTEGGPLTEHGGRGGSDVSAVPEAPTNQAASLLARPDEVQVPSTATTPVPVDGPHQVPSAGSAGLARRASAPDGEVAAD